MDTPVKKASLMKWDNPEREGETRTYLDLQNLISLASFNQRIILDDLIF